jgi:predicted transcriptional regulator with HTH domain
MKSRYREDESLVGLELVEEKKSGSNIKLYGLTSFGKEMIENMLRDK